jgi:hypothetical protein
VELPWTPRRLEQRIGRVDRLGQRRRVHALHLAHRGSYEGTVIARLERRRARALQMDASTCVVDAGAAAATARLWSIVGRRDAAGRPGAVYASRSRARASRVHLLYSVTLIDAAGRFVQRTVVAMQIECASWPGRRLSRAILRQFCVHEGVWRTLEQQNPRLVSAARDTTATAAAAMDRRLSALVSHLERLGQTGMWQASLFDRRAEQQARARRSSIAGLQEHLRHRLRAVRSLGHVSASEPQLIAAWLE